MDETYQTYLNRVARLSLPATLKSQLQHIQGSPKFQRLPDGSRQAVPFPGYTVVTPPSEEESENLAFYGKLETLQQKLLQELDAGLLVAVPPDSFHLTLADLIWDSAYRDAKQENPDFEQQLQERIRESFQKSQLSTTNSHPLEWQLLGLTIMPRALGVCLAPKNEGSYEPVLRLRRAIYQNSGLMALRIEQQYHFTAHVTLGYFVDVSPDLDRDRVADTLSELSERSLTEEATTLTIRQAQLRKFDDMMRFYREPDWPVLEF